jgi:type II secretory pathway component PulC
MIEKLSWPQNKGTLMKSPLWILNSALTLLFCGVIILMFAMRVNIPSRKSLTPQAIAPLHKEVSKINITRIYESDLFNTYIKPTIPALIPQSQAIKLPQPPAPKAFEKTPKAPPQFLAPLDIDLKGVVFNSNNIHSRAIVANRKTKEEKLYKIGDSILDGSLIYIGKNKAIFIRSNGQQETLFVTEEDAKKDPLYSDQQWTTSVEKINDTTFVINTEPFMKQVNNLAHLLDLLDITTAFEKGKSIGCRVGKMSGSLGSSIGLEQGDIITTINSIPTTNTTDRVKIYKEIKEKKGNSSITVIIKRQNNNITLNYTVRNKLLKKVSRNEIKNLPAGTPFTVDGKQIITPAQKDLEIAEETLAQADDNNAIAELFKKNDKKAMLNYGGRDALLRR